MHTLRAVKEELADGVDALLTPDASDEIKLTQVEREERSKEISAIDGFMIEETCARCASPLEFETEQEPQLCDAVKLLALETVVDEAQTTKSSFLQDQGEDSTLGSAWEQARCGTHGIPSKTDSYFISNKTRAKRAGS